MRVDPKWILLAFATSMVCATVLVWTGKAPWSALASISTMLVAWLARSPLDMLPPAAPPPPEDPPPTVKEGRKP